MGAMPKMTGSLRPFFVLVILLAIGLVGSSLPALAEDLVVHYHRPDGDYDGWTLHTWNASGGSGGVEARATGTDAFGLIFRVDLSSFGGASRIGMLPKFRNWDGKDDPDRYWTPEVGKEIYILSQDKQLYTQTPDIRPRVVGAYVDSLDQVRIVLSKSMSYDEVDAARATVRDADGRVYPVINTVGVTGANTRVKIINVTLGEPLPINRAEGGRVSFGDYADGPLSLGRIVDGFFDGRPLGAIYSPSRTTFRVFAPTASALSVLLWDVPTGGTVREVPMQKHENGIWQVVVAENLLNKYYKLRSTVPEGTFEVIDPYSRCNTAHNGRGMVTADPIVVAPGPDIHPADAVIYELHIRDFTIDPNGGVRMRGKYLGLTETGTRLAGHPEITTGLDHLKELGVNTIHILPIQDFDNNEESEEYNWGYMPYHFFSPDGWYATRRDDTTRIRETKAMVDALHRAGFRVILDVVHNHTAEGNPEVRMSFNGLAPNYYYRLKEDGTYWNGSGCGNEFRSESPFGRKYIVDCLQYWTREYGFDGFRFDLMGLIDLQTMKEVVVATRALKVDAFIYGEPWAAGQTPIDITSKGDQRGEEFSVFNDHFRDALRGPAFGKDPGFLAIGREIQRVKKGIMGSITDFALHPYETINYIEKHDNETLLDRLVIGTRNRADVTPAVLQQMQQLGAAIIFTSQGVPFFQAGMEFMRTKGGDGNSYNKPDAVNQVHWNWKLEHNDVFQYFRGLIHLRLAHPMFRMRTADEIKRSLFFVDDDLGMNVPLGAVAYVLNRGTTGDTWQNALLLFNANSTAVEVPIPAGDWRLVVNGRHAGEEPLAPVLARDRVTVSPYTALVFYNQDASFYGRVLEPAMASRASRSHTFSVSAPGAGKVTVAGSFNGWDMNRNVMVKQADGTWTLTLELDRGTYEYKFVQDGNWDTLNAGNHTLTIP